jgi:hypothetical protein
VIVPGTNSIQVIAQRAFSRVRAILVSFSGTVPEAADLPQKIRPYYTDSGGTAAAVTLKDVNYFAGPAGMDPSKFQDLLEAQLTIGGMTVPALPQRGISTMYYYLRQCVQQVFNGSMNISSLDEYSTVSFVLGFNLERTPGAGAFSGLSLMAGQSVNLHLNHVLPPGNPPNAQDLLNNGNSSLSGVYLHFLYDAILNVTGAGAELQQ